MGDKISRRSFLRGTGKTILTAGALSSGIGLSTSTTPTKVIPKVLKAPPRLLSPKARAYRSYLKGIRGVAVAASGGKGSIRMLGGDGKIRSIITKPRIGTGKTQAIAEKSLARQAFDDSTKKVPPRQGGPLSGGVPRKGSRILASQIAPNPQAKIPPMQRTPSTQKGWMTMQETVARNLRQDARTKRDADEKTAAGYADLDDAQKKLYDDDLYA